jgi:hypothetical protein
MLSRTFHCWPFRNSLSAAARPLAKVDWLITVNSVHPVIESEHYVQTDPFEVHSPSRSGGSLRIRSTGGCPASMPLRDSV